MAFALVFALAAFGAKAKKQRTKERQLTTLEIIEKVNDRYQATHKAEVKAFWDDAAYFTGNMEAYRMTGKAQYLEYSDRWARHNRWQGARGTDPKRWRYRNYGEGQDYVLFGDWQICFQTYIDLYELNPNPYKIARAKEVMTRESLMPQNDFWWWADALYMVMPVMTKMYKITGDELYLDKLYANFSYADSLMYDSVAHLYFRDGKYIYPKHKSYNGKKDFWARGDGWVLAGLAKVLTDMPRNYRHRSFFEQRFRELAAAVAACQQKEGHWTRSMLDADHADGYETSGTAFFTYGLYWGMNNGYLDRDTYLPVAEKGWKYLTTIALQPDFSIGYVQPIGEKAIRGQQLTSKNEANFGTGAFLLAACEQLRFTDNSTYTPKDGTTVTVKIDNPSTDLRNEVVEINAADVFRQLGISGGRQLRVFNSLEQEVAYQLTHDGKLLVEVAVNPLSTATLKIRKGTPKTFPNACYGRQFPERLDDIAWENDRTAYRCYGPALQKRKEKAYGYDVWVKNTPDLIVEERYHSETLMNARADRVRKSNRAAADSIIHSMSYHLDHGKGLDPYTVGPTMGCGSTAIMQDGKLVFPYCYDSCAIKDNGPLRFTVELTFKPSTIDGDTAVVEHRIISLDKGSNFNRTTVWYDGLTHPVDFCCGIVVHEADTASIVVGKTFVLYADPTDRPADHQFKTFLAVAYPDDAVTTQKLMLDKAQGEYAGHALCVKRQAAPTDKHTYWFGSAWSKYDCRSLAEWQLRTEAMLRANSQPLTITIGE